jgi:hypothetical protein
LTIEEAILIRDLWHVFLVGILAILALIGLAGFRIHSIAARAGAHSGTTANTSATLNVLPTTLSVTVSPGRTTFSDCHGGSPANRSTTTQLGYPNAECSIGTLGTNGTFPVTIENTGISSKIEVSASNAIPADRGRQLQLCAANGHVTCDGPNQKPGANQYQVWTASPQAARPSGTDAELTTKFTCDFAFDANSFCPAARSQTQTEGIELRGPTSWSDTSTSYTVIITWMAAPP